MTLDRLWAEYDHTALDLADGIGAAADRAIAARQAIRKEIEAPWRKTLGAAALELHMFRANRSADHAIQFRDCEYETCAEARALLSTTTEEPQ